MKNKTIAIIGATGNMGTALSKSLARAGYSLLLYGRDRKDIDKLMGEISSGDKSRVGVAESLDKIGEKADMLILAVPYEAEQELNGHLSLIFCPHTRDRPKGYAFH